MNILYNYFYHLVEDNILNYSSSLAEANGPATNYTVATSSNPSFTKIKYNLKYLNIIW